MGTDTLRRHMLNFSIETLKCFLGTNLVDTLIEWTPDNETLFTKTKLVDMILAIHGINILKDKNFRATLLKTFTKDNIERLASMLPASKKYQPNIMDMIEAIVDMPWRDNKVSKQLLTMLDIKADIFERIEVAGSAVNEILSNDRFFELLDYQFVIKQRILGNLNSEAELSRMLVHMPTGTGKTKTAMHTICHYYNFSLEKPKLILWIAHTTELLQQAFDTFSSVWQHLGSGEITTYKLWGEHIFKDSDFDNGGIVFCGIQKLMSLASTEPQIMEVLIKNCALIVFDEAHKAAAAETRRTIEKFMLKKDDMCNRSLVGLTATPGRFTELNVGNDLLASMFGNRMIEIDTEIMNSINMSKLEALNASAESNIIAYFQEKRILAQITKEQLTYPEGLSDKELKSVKRSAIGGGYDDFTSKQLEIIGRNKNRNLAIMCRLRELSRDKLPTIVFTCSVDHGKLLASMLSLEGIPNALVIGSMLPTDRANAIAAFKNRDNPTNIIINYEVLTTGFDSTNIKCVFITRPTKSVVLYSQMLGRGLRGPQMGGNEECLLIDIKDNLEKYDEELAFGHFNNYWKV